MLDVFTHFMPKPFLDRLGDLIPGHPVLTAFPRPAPRVAPRTQSALDTHSRIELVMLGP
jgi:hypothetical protein